MCTFAHQRKLSRKQKDGASLAVQWLRVCACNAGGAGSIPGRGTRITQGTWWGQKKNKKTPSQNQIETDYKKKFPIKLCLIKKNDPNYQTKESVFYCGYSLGYKIKADFSFHSDSFLDNPSFLKWICFTFTTRKNIYKRQKKTQKTLFYKLKYHNKVVWPKIIHFMCVLSFLFRVLLITVKKKRIKIPDFKNKKPKLLN